MTQEEIKEAAYAMISKNAKIIGSYPNNLVVQISKQISISECQSLIDELNLFIVELFSYNEIEFINKRISRYQDIKDYLQSL
jgi:hypothetical protein